MRIDWQTKYDDENKPAYYYANLWQTGTAYIMPSTTGEANAYIQLDTGVRLTAPRTFATVAAAKRWVKRQTTSNVYVQYADVWNEQEAQP